MRLRILLCIFLLILPTLAVHAVWTSPAPRSAPDKDNVYTSGMLRAQVRYRDWAGFFETNYRVADSPIGNMRSDGATNQTATGQESFRQQTWHALLGGYYNILNSLMVGGFYRYAEGERHRNDWIGSGWGPNGTSNAWDWFWLNSNNRPEHTVMGDITWRYALDFLPGENWVFEFKNRLWYTWYSDDRYASRDNWGQHTANISETKYIIRPGLQYFWLAGDRPFMTFFAQYEAHFALNFGTRTLVESWAYLGFLYHITPEAALGLNIAYAQWWWSESDSVRNIRAQETCSAAGSAAYTCNTTQYVTTQRAFIVGAIAMFRFDMTPVD